RLTPRNDAVGDATTHTTHHTPHTPHTPHTQHTQRTTHNAHNAQPPQNTPHKATKTHQKGKNLTKCKNFKIS
ncbi:hypothetical protein, partial [Helicobacter rodentium]